MLHTDSNDRTDMNLSSGQINSIIEHGDDELALVGKPSLNLPDLQKMLQVKLIGPSLMRYGTTHDDFLRKWNLG